MRRSRLAAVVLFACACADAREEERAPASAEAPPEPPPPDAPVPYVEHVVGDGETLWDIARAYEVDVADITEANGLTRRDIRRLSQGRTLRIPGRTEVREVETRADREQTIAELPPLEDGAYHVLGDGETLWDLARLYDKTVDELVERNGFTDDDVTSLRAGRPVIVPGIRASDVRSTPADEPAARTGRGVMHTIAPGETIWDLAGAFQVSVAEIMSANRLGQAEASALSVGARVFIPGVSEDRSGRVRRRMTPAQRRAATVAARLGLGTRHAASDLYRGIVRREWIRAAGSPTRLPGNLRWPVTNGWFVRGYGSGEQGYHLATDIAGEMGWNVRAAAPGIVGYSGNEISGYGNMVLVIHPGGWVTMYAHNSTNFVVAGQRVDRGSILAELGSTGISRGPHVHFEFIFDGKNCDPSALFRPGIRHRNGRMTPIDPLSWDSPRERPRGLDCAPRRRFPHSQRVIDE